MEIDWLKRQCIRWRKLKNDVDKQKARVKLRHAAIEKGFTNDDVSNMIRTVRKSENESKQSTEPKPPPPPESKPTLLEGSTERPQDRGAGSGTVGLPGDDRRVKPVAPREDLNPSGGKLRSKNRPSILDMIDAKRKPS